MLTAPNIDPVAISIGPLKVHWYGLMYVFGLLALWFLASRRARRPNSGWTTEEVGDLVFYGALGVILGGRIGYMLFYNLPHYLEHPLDIFRIWEGGMSFHGGLVGTLLAVLYFARKTGKRFFAITDFVAPWVPIGLGLGRIGNFINQELWGKVTNLPWGMVFRDAGPLPRHPSQLYQASLEGVALFVILWLFTRKPRPTASVSGLFLIGYGLFRFLVEFVREPDPQLGYLAWGWLTMGQVLSFPMILVGIGLMVWAYRAAAATKS
jgi:phosphatidylglycerol:prolipoprotein diacylglycerol transferase